MIKNIRDSVLLFRLPTFEKNHIKFATHLVRDISITKQLIRLGPVWGPDSSSACSSRCLLASWRRGLFIIQPVVIFMNRSSSGALVLELDATLGANTTVHSSVQTKTLGLV